MLATPAERAMGLASRSSNDGLPQTTIELELHSLDAGQLGEFVESRCRVNMCSRDITFRQADVFATTAPMVTAEILVD